MVIYYRTSGAIADFALMLNLVCLVGALAGLNATLTLPGIAGIILTIGMGVDSNVLILERIREELRTGKPVRPAVDTGYDKAFLTIVDSHVTTRYRPDQGLCHHAVHGHRDQPLYRPGGDESYL
jgi:preprotein translocase subunit SecD